MRIARALALVGIAARRKCEEIVAQGKVTVNGEVVRDLGRQVDADRDEITYLGRPVRLEPKIYFLLNKPVGYTTTASDPYAKKTVYRLLPPTLVSALPLGSSGRKRVFPVGRLDRDSTGLILFTNDGELANHLTHPRYQVEKWYQVRLNRPLDPEARKRLLRGIWLGEGKAKIERIEVISGRSVRVLIREGKKREIRRVFARVGYRVMALTRVAFGPLKLGTLASGRGRFLTDSEVQRLREEASSLNEGANR